MSSIRVNESPNHFMVLDAISRGVKTIDKIAKVTRLDKAEVNLIVNDLVAIRRNAEPTGYRERGNVDDRRVAKL